jgi:hypothetical protein
MTRPIRSCYHETDRPILSLLIICTYTSMIGKISKDSTYRSSDHNEYPSEFLTNVRPKGHQKHHVLDLIGSVKTKV